MVREEDESDGLASGGLAGDCLERIRDWEKGFGLEVLGGERVGEERERFKEGLRGGSGVRKGLEFGK